MKYVFLILSNQPFDFELKTNKWHVATRLAERGYKVIYVDPPVRFRALKEFLKEPSLNLGKLFFRTEIKNKNLIVYKPANIFNFKPFSYINTAIHSNKIIDLIKQVNPELKGDQNIKTILWVYHFDFPDLDNFVKKVRHDLMIYDIVDEYTEFPEYSLRKRMNTGIIAKFSG
jgi:hypothetical protein